MPCENLFVLTLEVDPVSNKIVPRAQMSPVLSSIDRTILAKHCGHLLWVCNTGTVNPFNLIYYLDSTSLGIVLSHRRCAFKEVVKAESDTSETTNSYVDSYAVKRMAAGEQRFGRIT